MQYYAQRYMTQINDLFATIPSSLLLLLKTNDCLRQLDKSVGRPVNTLTGLSVCLSVCLFSLESFGYLHHDLISSSSSLSLCVSLCSASVVLETTSEVIFEEEIRASRTFEELNEIWLRYLTLRGGALVLKFLSSWIE
jgi:hypothetical protein